MSQPPVGVPPSQVYPPEGPKDAYPPQGYGQPYPADGSKDTYPPQGYAQPYPQQGSPPQGYPQQGYAPQYPPHQQQQQQNQSTGMLEGCLLLSVAVVSWRLAFEWSLYLKPRSLMISHFLID